MSEIVNPRETPLMTVKPPQVLALADEKKTLPVLNIATHILLLNNSSTNSYLDSKVVSVYAYSGVWIYTHLCTYNSKLKP